MESRESERKRKEILSLLANIQDHFKRLGDYDNIPSLELNVILSKISKLQEKTSVLKYLMHKKEDDSFEENKAEADEQAEVKEVKEEEVPVEVEEEVKNEKVVSSESEVKEKTAKKNIQENEYIDPAETSSGKGIGKLEDYLDLNAKFSGEDHSLSDQLKKQPIANLLTAIGLNERYLFANQLFNGDMAKFIDEIKKLNSFEKEEEALDYFDNQLSNKESWKSSEDLVEAFRLLVERRFQE